MMVCGHHPHLFFFFFLNHKYSGEQNILNIKPIFADNKTSCQLKSVCVYFPVPWEGPGLLDSLVYTSGEVCLQGDCRTGGSCRHVAVHFQRLTCCGKAPFSSCLLEWCLSSAVRAAACWKWAEQQSRPRSLAVVISASQTVKHRTDGLFVAAFSRHPPVITVNREEGMSLACVLNVGCWHMKCFKPRSSFTKSGPADQLCAVLLNDAGISHLCGYSALQLLSFLLCEKEMYTRAILKRVFNMII